MIYVVVVIYETLSPGVSQVGQPESYQSCRQLAKRKD